MLEVHRLEDAGPEEADVGGEARAGMACRGTPERGCSVSAVWREARIHMAGTAAKATRGMAAGQQQWQQRWHRQPHRQQIQKGSMPKGQHHANVLKATAVQQPLTDDKMDCAARYSISAGCLAAPAQHRAGTLVGVVVAVPRGVHLRLQGQTEG